MNFTEEEMMADLKAADAAGDTELAQHIASLIRERRAQSTASQVPSQVPPKAAIPDTSLAGQISSNWENRNREKQQIQEDYKSGKINEFQAGLDLIGKDIFGRFGDVVGAPIAFVTPDVVKELAAEGIAAIEGTDAGQWIKEHWDELPPEIQRNIESGTNIITSVVPWLKAAKSKTLKTVGADISESAKIAKTRKLAHVAPEADFNKQIMKEMLGEVPEEYTNVLRRIVDDVDMRATTSDKALTKKLNTINKKYTAQLNKELSRTTQNLSAPTLYTLKNNKISELGANNKNWVDAQTGTFKPEYQKIMDSAQEDFRTAMLEFDGTAVSLNKVRQKFDDYQADRKDMFKESEYNPFTGTSAANKVTRAYRNSINEMIESVSPKAAELNKKISAVMRVNRNFATKKAKTFKKDGAIASVLDVMESHPLATAGLLSGSFATGLGAPMAAIGAAPLIYSQLQRGRPLSGMLSGALNSPMGRGMMGYGAAQGAMYQSPEEEAMK